MEGEGGCLGEGRSRHPEMSIPSHWHVKNGVTILVFSTHMPLPRPHPLSDPLQTRKEASDQQRKKEREKGEISGKKI